MPHANAAKTLIVIIALPLSGFSAGATTIGCSSSPPSSSQCVSGSEGCACRSDNTCDAGLACDQLLCHASGYVGTGGSSSLPGTMSTANGGSPSALVTGFGGSAALPMGTLAGGGNTAATGAPGTEIPAYQGCWITTTSTGNTKLEFTRSSGGAWTGNLLYSNVTYPVTSIVAGPNRLTFTVDWYNYNYLCNYDFTNATATALSGKVHCGNLDYDITADRSCD